MEPTDRADPSPQSDIKTLELLRQQAYDFYVRKSYSESADVYAQASEVQARLYGEDDGANADLLYLYGRSLYQVGVGKSDVLGGKVTETEVTRPKAVQPSRSRPSQPGDIHPGSQERVIADAIRDVRSESLGQALEKSDGAPSKPFFSISGDEDLISTNGQHDGNDMPSDDDLDGGDDDDEGAGGPDNEDELALAWEILDLSRLMFKKQLEGYLGSNISSDGDHKTPITASDPIQQTSPSTQQRPPLPVRQVEERLADVHDLLAEISLEGEDFALAVTDFRASLLYKNKLYPTESELIAEAHFKLSLALELAGNTSATEGGDLESEGDSAEAHAAASRKEAEAEMELAIESCKARIRREEEKLRNMGDTPDSAEHQAAAKKSEKRRADVKEMILEMEQRLHDLRRPVENPGLGGEKSEREELKDILGAIMGQMPEEAKKEIKDAVAGATDLSKIVRKKKAERSVPPEESISTASNGTKRKASGGLDGDMEIRSPKLGNNLKKAKVEEVEDDVS